MTEAWNSKRGLFAVIALAVGLLGVNVATAAAAPKWRIFSLSSTTASTVDNPATPNLEENRLTYSVQIENVGDEPIPPTMGGNSENCVPGAPPPAEEAKCFTFTASLPAGLTPLDAKRYDASGNKCSVSGQSVTCAYTGEEFQLPPSEARLRFLITAAVDPGAAGTLISSFQIAGGEAGSASTVDPTRITPTPPSFGVEAFDTLIAADGAGTPMRAAGAHPYGLLTSLAFNTAGREPALFGENYPVEAIRNATVDLPVGFIGNPSAADRCTMGDLANGLGIVPKPLCSSSSQVGTVLVDFSNRDFSDKEGGISEVAGPIPLYNMQAPPGSAARFGFNVLGTLVTLDAQLHENPSGEYVVSVSSRKTSEALAVVGTEIEFWGQPADPVHTPERSCAGQAYPRSGGPSCPSSAPDVPFFRMPTSCTPAGEGLAWSIHMDSWEHPGAELADEQPDLSDPAWKSKTIETHEAPGFPYPEEIEGVRQWGDSVGVEECDRVPVKGSLSATPTSIDTETSSGLAVHVEVPNVGLENRNTISTSDIKGVKVTLPQGVTINPSQAEGLGVCSPAQYESTELSFFPTPGKGCPDNSKIGSVEVHTQLLDETIPGDVYIAQQDDPATSQHGAENPFDSLLAIYIVLHEPQRGILIRLPGKVETDEATGRIVTTFDNLPQTPFESFDFHFREGARAPLVTPPTCGTYTTEAVFTPWSDPTKKLESDSSFQIVHGIGGGPCPSGGTPPFHPGFSAGSINNNAGAYSPFNMRLTRSDGEQDMTRFSAVLPPGVLGKLAGVGKCPDSAIAIAKAKTGRQEQASPSCPANSEIGRSLVGAGVGSVLTYVPGQIYLGGPFHGDPLSVIAITPAVAGPFDVGTVVVHQALTLNPKTAEVEVDGSASDPIPHILKGIPAKLRDIRVYVDRDKFTLNPTSCDPSATDATLFGSGGNVFSSADDVPVSLSDRFQAASCASLGFKPKLALNLKGGTKRGGHPGLTATYKPRSGDANVKGLVVTLPRSAFLDQGHIRTICTRVQFAAKACPKAAQYGFIKAFTPLLDQPLEGPVYLRSSNHKLPDLVFDLHGLVDVEVATRIDSFHGGIRASVEDAPDAPLSKVLLKMQGAKKGLIVNSRNLCAGINKADVGFTGQNGKEAEAKPELRPQCAGKGRKAGKGKRR
jgi:hypothetical protein